MHQKLRNLRSWWMTFLRFPTSFFSHLQQNVSSRTFGLCSNLLRALLTAYASDITPQSLVNLLSQGVNVIFVYSDTQTPISSLATEFSLIPAPPHTPLISHFPPRDPPYTVVPIQPPAVNDPKNSILSQGLNTVYFSGAPHALGLSPYLIPILRAPSESFAGDTDSDSGADSIVDAAEKGGEGLWAGSQLSVVTGFQTRNGARALWVGGADLFSDEFAEKEVERCVMSYQKITVFGKNL